MSALTQSPFPIVLADTPQISKNPKFFALKSADIRIWRNPFLLVQKMSALDKPFPLRLRTSLWTASYNTTNIKKYFILLMRAHVNGFFSYRFGSNRSNLAIILILPLTVQQNARMSNFNFIERNLIKKLISK